MAKLQNTFLKSKMNKDLDDRLIPTGEYRDALNITVGKSESSSVGTAQNVLGNTAVVTFNVPAAAKCIGKIEDDSKNIAIFFITDYEDSSETQINDAASTNYCSIILVDFNDSENITSSVLVEGYWLNLATNNQYTITGVNLIENLLFWTDNRNQPRKINIDTALTTPGYYTTEHQISVAKYAPVDAIQLFKKIDTKINQTAASPATAFIVDSVLGITVGMFMISSTVEGNEYVQVTAVDTGTNQVTVSTGNANFLGIQVIDNQDVSFLTSTMTDASSDTSWSGDPDYLESRYVRFSYRLRYNDNEYSTFAPFTQICFIPKQKGYFINGNEESALRSTIVDWFENNVNNIELLIPLPTIGSKLSTSYNISEIDILYKESEGLTVSVLKTISASEIASSVYANTNIFTYTYKSSKPYKTLPEAQTVRVYDKVPVRARAQEVSGNRVIYGNYRDAWTSPNPINYNVSVQGKTDEFTNFIEYPNHTLKQNRNYQVGFILADKYNRQSSVVLSSNDDGVTTAGQLFGGSTVYSSYENDQLDVKKWFGNALRVLVNTPISALDNTQAGTPGLYANPISTGDGFAIISAATISGSIYTFSLDPSYSAQNQVPEVGNYMRGQFTDYVEVLTQTGTGNGPYVVTTDGQVNSSYLFDDLQSAVANTKFAYDINARGWYSYKVVVKQQEQQYYNSYLPGMLNGYPKGQTSGNNTLNIQTEIIQLPSQTGTGNNVIRLPNNTQAQNIIVGMIVQNITTDFGIADPVLVVSVVVNSNNIDVTVSATVVANQSDFIKFLYPQSVTQYGVNTTSFPVNEINKTAHVVLINDNINKIPRDLTEVGPDQKQFRSSVELYGRVENFGQTFQMLDGTSEPVQNTQKTNKIIYDPTIANGEIIFNTITAGDSMTALNGGNATQDLYPSKWLKDTVVVSNELNAVGTNATITFTPPQLIYGNPNQTTEFEFVKEENKQYYPARKADTVNTISTAKDLNFIANSVENIRGSAALNLYQLESNPLVARISTVSAIGETTGQMIPFLSVYETKPVESQLEIFWETASTGLISDLNDDVLTGFDGPVGFTATGYTHFEDQDPSQVGTGTGVVDSAYVTNIFTAVNNQGSPLTTSTTLILTEVLDGSNTSRLGDFILEPVNLTTNPGEYRIKIVENPNVPFVFNRNARSLQEYEFSIRVNYQSLGQPLNLTLTTSGRLGNRQPIIVGGCDSYGITINQQATTVTTIVAKNGAFESSGANVQSDIFYEILTGGQYFNIDQSGNITVDLPTGTTALPIGVYTLNVRVTDAYNIDALTGDTLAQFNSISTDCVSQSVVITVGQEKTPGGFHTDAALIFEDEVLNYRGFEYPGSGEGGYYNTTFDPSISGFGEGTGSGFGACSPVIQPNGNPGVIRMCTTNTVSNRIARPTTLGDGTSSGASGNVKFAVLYMGPRGVDIDVSATSNTMGKNVFTGTGVDAAELPIVDANDYVVPLSPTGGSNWTTGGPFAAGVNLETSNAPAGISVGLVSGQALITNKVIASGDWSNNTINFNRGNLNAGQVELDYKIYRRSSVIDANGDTVYAANSANGWVQVSDVNGSVPTTGWGNACTGSTASGNNLFAKVQFSSQTQIGEARTASREDSFVLDGTKFPGEYCVIYRFTNTSFSTPSLINGAGGVWYPTGELNGGTISVGVQDLNFKYDSVTAGELRFAPTTNPAQFSVNPSYSNSVSGAFPVGYDSQFTTTGQASNVSFKNYELAEAAASGDFDLVFKASDITTNGISPYLKLTTQTGISADTAIIKIEVDGDINKVKLNQAIAGNLAVGTIISIGRTDISNPFASNVNTTLFSTVGRVNTVSQFFYDVACTQVFDLINSDNSGSLFKLYNQSTNGPNFINYSTASSGGSPTSPATLDDLMPQPPDKPIGSVRFDGGGNIVDLGANTPNRGLSPIAQDLKA